MLAEPIAWNKARHGLTALCYNQRPLPGTLHQPDIQQFETVRFRAKRDPFGERNSISPPHPDFAIRIGLNAFDVDPVDPVFAAVRIVQIDRALAALSSKHDVPLDYGISGTRHFGQWRIHLNSRASPCLKSGALQQSDKLRMVENLGAPARSTLERSPPVMLGNRHKPAAGPVQPSAPARLAVQFPTTAFVVGENSNLVEYELSVIGKTVEVYPIGGLVFMPARPNIFASRDHIDWISHDLGLESFREPFQLAQGVAFIAATLSPDVLLGYESPAVLLNGYHQMEPFGLHIRRHDKHSTLVNFQVVALAPGKDHTRQHSRVAELAQLVRLHGSPPMG